MLNKLAEEFNRTYDIKPIQHEKDKLVLVNDLIFDELLEMSEEIDKADTKGVAAEMADIIYITMERMKALGFDVDALLIEKHRSNMSKVIPIDASLNNLKRELEVAQERYPEAYLQNVIGGFVLKCKATSKVIKPMCYSKAVITDAMIGKR